MSELESDAVILSQSKRIATLEAEINELRKTVRTGRYNRQLHYRAIAWATARRNKEDRLKKYRAFRKAVLSDPNTYNGADWVIRKSDVNSEMLSAAQQVVIAERELINAIEDHIASFEAAIPPT